MLNSSKHPLKFIRDQHGLTQSDFGLLIDKSRGYVAQVETGNLNLNEEKVVEVCNHFGLTRKVFDKMLNEYKLSRLRALMG